MSTKEYLSRREAAEYVQARGLPCALATLNKLACVGGGPVIHYFGRLPRYTPSDLEAWISSKLRSCTSTSELVRAA
jgi:hypothetical protein